MARRIGSRIKLSRRYGQAIFGTAKEAKILQRRNYPPGQHGPSATGRLSEYGIQLKEKQKAKAIYGLLERQFRNYYEEALRRPGDTGQVLLQNLERRLDNTVYRLGLATTRAQARQIVTHGHLQVNNRRVNIPSFRVKTKDIVAVRPQSLNRGYFTIVKKSIENHQPPAWLTIDKSALSGQVIDLPSGDQLERGIQPQLIVEFYSR